VAGNELGRADLEAARHTILAQLLAEQLHLVSSQFDQATSIFASFPLPRTTATR
jgi:hypothetical protein